MSFSDPKKIIPHLDIHESMHVADIGAGSGFYTLEIAKRVGQGKVYAIDIQKELLARIKNHAHKERYKNVEIIWSDVDEQYGTTLKDASVNRVLLSNTLFQLEKKEIAVNEIKRILKPGGQVLVVDWADSYGNLGPTANNVVTRAKAKLLFEEAGFIFEHDVTVGAHHYGIIFKR
jgi:ubiquinone/menaquinone biosynthesis C-methylase UbiE